jgi:hypothetical protein
MAMPAHTPPPLMFSICNVVLWSMVLLEEPSWNERYGLNRFLENSTPTNFGHWNGSNDSDETSASGALWNATIEQSSPAATTAQLGTRTNARRHCTTTKTTRRI